MSGREVFEVQHESALRAQSQHEVRESMQSLLYGEIATESELAVPTFIRRHSASQQ